MDSRTYLAIDMFAMMKGEKLGSGAYRDVFECNLNPKWVIKVEAGRKWCNVAEFLIWRDWQNCPKIAEWLAPIHHISPDGHILIQSRTKPLNRRKLPKTLPKFLTDIKPENFGILNGRVVCHDYAFILSTLKHDHRKVKWNGDIAQYRY